jgi:hypothetical protein
MADLKISQLPDLQTAPTEESEIIVNDNSTGDFVTRRVQLSKLKVGGDSSNTYFDPQRYVLDLNTGGSSISRVAYAGMTANEIYATVVPFEIEFPANATHFFVNFFAHDTWRWNKAVGNSSSTSNWRNWELYTNRKVTFDGATVNQGSSDTMQMSFQHNVCWTTNFSGYDDNGTDAPSDQINSHKQKLFKITAPVTTNSTGQSVKKVSVSGQLVNMRARNCLWSAYMGDITIIPMNATPTGAVIAGALFSSVDPDIEVPDGGQSTATEIAKSQAKEDAHNLRNQGKTFLDCINDFLTEYEAGKGPSQADRDALEPIYARLYNLTFGGYAADGVTKLATYAEIQAAMNVETDNARTIMTKLFDFEVQLGISSARNDTFGF